MATAKQDKVEIYGGAVAEVRMGFKRVQMYGYNVAYSYPLLFSVTFKVLCEELGEILSCLESRPLHIGCCSKQSNKIESNRILVDFDADNWKIPVNLFGEPKNPSDIAKDICCLLTKTYSYFLEEVDVDEMNKTVIYLQIPREELVDTDTEKKMKKQKTIAEKVRQRAVDDYVSYKSYIRRVVSNIETNLQKDEGFQALKDVAGRSVRFMVGKTNASAKKGMDFDSKEFNTWKTGKIQGRWRDKYKDKEYNGMVAVLAVAEDDIPDILKGCKTSEDIVFDIEEAFARKGRLCGCPLNNYSSRVEGGRTRGDPGPDAFVLYIAYQYIPNDKDWSIHQYLHEMNKQLGSNMEDILNEVKGRTTFKNPDVGNLKDVQTAPTVLSHQEGRDNAKTLQKPEVTHETNDPYQEVHGRRKSSSSSEDQVPKGRRLSISSETRSSCSTEVQNLEQHFVDERFELAKGIIKRQEESIQSKAAEIRRLEERLKEQERLEEENAELEKLIADFETAIYDQERENITVHGKCDSLRKEIWRTWRENRTLMSRRHILLKSVDCLHEHISVTIHGTLRQLQNLGAFLKDKRNDTENVQMSEGQDTIIKRIARVNEELGSILSDAHSIKWEGN